MTPDEIAAMLNAVQGGGFGAPPEYSASQGGYMPPDVGSMGSGLNSMQDVLQLAQNPLVLMLLGMTSGPQFGMVDEVVDEGSNAGAAYLQNVIDNYGASGVSYEAFIADQILHAGRTPSQAVAAWENFMKTTKIQTDDGEKTIEKAYGYDDDDFYKKEMALELAIDYSDRLMSDRAPVVNQVPGAGLEMAQALGLDPNQGFSFADLNPDIVPAAQNYESRRDEYNAARRIGMPDRLTELPGDSAPEEPAPPAGSKPLGGLLGRLTRGAQTVGIVPNVDRDRGLAADPDTGRTSASSRHLGRVNVGRERRYQPDAASRAAVRQMLPSLAAAQTGLATQSGIAAARRDINDARGITPASQQLRAMLEMIQGASTGQQYL